MLITPGQYMEYLSIYLCLQFLSLIFIVFCIQKNFTSLLKLFLNILFYFFTVVNGFAFLISVSYSWLLVHRNIINF